MPGTPASKRPADAKHYEETWCEGDCPYLDCAKESLEARCKVFGELIWYDGFIASCCAEGVEVEDGN